MFFIFLGIIHCSENSVFTDETEGNKDKIKYNISNQSKYEIFLKQIFFLNTVRLEKLFSERNKLHSENIFNTLDLRIHFNSSSHIVSCPMSRLNPLNQDSKHNTEEYYLKKNNFGEPKCTILDSQEAKCFYEDPDLFLEHYFNIVDCISYIKGEVKYKDHFSDIITKIFSLISHVHENDKKWDDLIDIISCEHSLYDTWDKLERTYFQLYTIKDNTLDRIGKMHRYIINKTIYMLGLYEIDKLKYISFYQEIIKEVSNISSKYAGLPGLYSLPILLRKEKSNNIEQMIIYFYLKVISRILDSMKSCIQNYNDDFTFECNEIAKKEKRKYDNSKWKNKMIRRYNEIYKNGNLVEYYHKIIYLWKNKYKNIILKKCDDSNIQIIACYNCISYLLGRSPGFIDILILKDCNETELYSIVNLVSGIIFSINEKYLFSPEKLKKNNPNYEIFMFKCNLTHIFISLKILNLQKDVDEEKNKDLFKLERCKKNLKDEVKKLGESLEIIDHILLYDECILLYRKITSETH